jgi:hypothetical protein
MVFMVAYKKRRMFFPFSSPFSLSWLECIGLITVVVFCYTCYQRYHQVWREWSFKVPLPGILDRWMNTIPSPIPVSSVNK